MIDAPEATMIVTLHDADDFDKTKKQLAKIKGVSSVEFNSLSRKLRIRYDASDELNLVIQAEIRKTISPYIG